MKDNDTDWATQEDPWSPTAVWQTPKLTLRPHYHVSFLWVKTWLRAMLLKKYGDNGLTKFWVSFRHNENKSDKYSVNHNMKIFYSHIAVCHHVNMLVLCVITIQYKCVQWLSLLTNFKSIPLMFFVCKSFFPFIHEAIGFSEY